MECQALLICADHELVALTFDRVKFVLIMVHRGHLAELLNPFVAKMEIVRHSIRQRFAARAFRVVLPPPSS
jgi:hypothetical protein